MEGIIIHLSSYLKFFPLNGYEAIFALAFLEALAFVGVLLPGSSIFVFIGFLTSLGYFGIAPVLLTTILGALFGDLASYYIGRRKGLDLKLGQKSIFRCLYFKEAGRFLLDQGGLSIVIGRFMGPTRAFVPFYMGAAGEKEKKFFLYDVIGVLIWAVSYLSLGYIFGSSLHLIRRFIGVVDFFVLLIIVLTVGSLIATRTFKKKVFRAVKKEPEEK